MEINKIINMREAENVENYLSFSFPAISKNEKLARNVVAAFLLDANPTVEILSDIKTAVSEAVTNSVVHGYREREGLCEVVLKLQDNCLYIKIVDYGVGISNIEEARQPFFTTGKSSERSGMGFTVMETFMDEVEVRNLEVGSGLVVEMVKEIQSK